MSIAALSPLRLPPRHGQALAAAGNLPFASGSMPDSGAPSNRGMHWDGSVYSNQYAFVFQHGQGVLALLAPHKGERILDLGCGTGELTREIAESGAHVIGLDQSRTMLDQARRHAPNIPFIQGDGSRLPYHQAFDAVFSNAAIHWMPQQERLLREVYRALKPGGRFVAEFGGEGNLQTIIQGLRQAARSVGLAQQLKPSPFFFPSVLTYQGLLERQGFRIPQMEIFERPTPLEGGKDGLRRWMTLFKNAFFEDLPPEKLNRLVDEMERVLRPKLFLDGAWVADYHRLRLVAVKPR